MRGRHPDADEILAYAHETEEEREDECRRIECRICGAKPVHRCRDSFLSVVCVRSHTGRYEDAVKLGLVPPLPRKPRRLR